MALVHLCAGCHMDFAIAHCNFQLRGEASDADERFVTDLATRFNKKLYINNFDTINCVDKSKGSLQMVARALRYDWFSKIMEEEKIGTLVTAHHADDALETFMINLSRGTGADGLSGIPSKTNRISRPLLIFSREQITQYAKAGKISWRDDESNSDTKYLRNKIRHEMVPLLKELHPTFLENFKLTQRHLSDTVAIVENHTMQLKASLFEPWDGLIRINVRDLMQLQPQRAYLYALFKGYGFTAWSDVVSLLTAPSGKEVRSKTHRLVKDRNHLLLDEHHPPNLGAYTIWEDQRGIDLPVHLTIEAVDGMGKTSNNVLYVDKKTLKYPLTVRKWKKGDYFHPLGMGGKKKLSKYFKDEKIDVISKERQWLLCSGDKIVWVIGKRADRRFKVLDETEHVLKFTLNK